MSINQEDLAAYRQKVAASAQAALSKTGTNKELNEKDQQEQQEQQQEQRQWRNLSDSKEYDQWVAERRDKPEDWERYKDERLSGALSGGSGLTDEVQRREYWKAKDALRGVEKQQ